MCDNKGNYHKPTRQRGIFPDTASNAKTQSSADAAGWDSRKLATAKRTLRVLTKTAPRSSMRRGAADSPPHHSLMVLWTNGKSGSRLKSAECIFPGKGQLKSPSRSLKLRGRVVPGVAGVRLGIRFDELIRRSTKEQSQINFRKLACLEIPTRNVSEGFRITTRCLADASC